MLQARGRQGCLMTSFGCCLFLLGDGLQKNITQRELEAKIGGDRDGTSSRCTGFQTAGLCPPILLPSTGPLTCGRKLRQEHKG